MASDGVGRWAVVAAVGPGLTAAGSASDGDLLDRFVRDRDEAAFAVLVARHGAMVWGVCRRVVRDHHAAEDAFQAAFLVLARRAGVVRPRDRVGPWLHGVALRTALRARGSEARRHVREGPAVDLRDHPDRSDADSLDADLLPRLDREVGRLPSKYRLPVVLCELEGLSYREAADRLGWPVGTVSGRLTRARSILAGRFRRPEVAHLGLAVALKSPAGAVVPPRLADATTQLARLVALGGWATAEVGSARSLTLMRGVLTTMKLARIRLVALSLAGLTLAAGGAGLTLRAVAGPPPTAQQPPVTKPADPSQAKAKGVPIDQMPTYSYRFDANNIREFPELTIDHGSIHLKTGPATVVPVVTEPGITGLVIFARGTYRFGPVNNKSFEGAFQPLTLLRFNPAELAEILPLEKGQRVDDKGVHEACLIATPPLVRHCWQSNSRTPTGERKQSLLIPPKGAVAAVLLTKEHGDLLIAAGAPTTSAGPPMNFVHSFTGNKTLLEVEAKPAPQ